MYLFFITGCSFRFFVFWVHYIESFKFNQRKAAAKFTRKIRKGPGITPKPCHVSNIMVNY